MRPLSPTFLLLTLLLLFQPWSASAMQRAGLAENGPLTAQRQQTLPDAVVMQNGGKSLNQAVQQVQRQYRGGRIISAETRRSGNREVHHIKVLTADGKVRTVKVQGRPLGSRG